MEPLQIITAVTSNTRLKIPKDCDPVFQRLMKQCWRQNPSHRPTFDKIADILNDYYKTLKRYQDIADDAFEASGLDSEDEPDGASHLSMFMPVSAGCLTLDECQTWVERV